jgi:hypothetical protein
MMLTFDMVFLPLFIVAMASVALGCCRNARVTTSNVSSAWDFFANAPDRKSSALFL